MPVLYPFGHGLSYTTFELNSLAITPSSGPASAMRRLSVRVANVGTRDGAETVLVFAKYLVRGQRRIEEEQWGSLFLFFFFQGI